MQNDALNIAFPEGFNQPNFSLELIETQGRDPKPLNEPVKYIVGVALSSIALLLAAGKYDEYATPKENPGVVLYGVQPYNFYINVKDNPRDLLANEYITRLELNPLLAEWAINSGKTFNIAQLEKFVLRHVNDFAEPGRVGALRKSLQNMEVKFESEYKKEDDRQGNKSEVRKTALKIVEGAFKDIFTWDLNMPLYKGQPKVAFTIDLEIDEAGGHPIVSFYCLQLEILLQESGETLIKNEVEKLAAKFVCLEQA